MRSLYSMEAEAGVIGAMILNKEIIEDIGAVLDRSHFYDQDYAEIYAQALRLHSRGVKIDLVSLSGVVEVLPSGALTLASVGDIQYNVSSAANGLHYAQIVKERFKARQLNELGKRLISLSQEAGSVSDQIATAQAAIMGLDAETDTQDVYQMSDSLNELVEDLQRANDGDGEKPLGTGLADVDKLMKGLRKGTLNIVAGRPGSGKSLMANMIARQAAIEHDGSALIFSLEMSNKELTKRMVASVGGVTLDDIESARAVQDQENMLKTSLALEKIKGADIRVCDRPGLEFAKMCAIARFQHRANPIKVMIVDYIGLVALGDNKRIQNRNQELGHISRGLKQLAKELDIPIVALAQLNRGIEGRVNAMPTMSDLRDSGEIEQDADVILICHRRDDEHGRSGKTLAEVVKCRHGQVGGTVIQMQGHYARFVNAASGDYDLVTGGTGSKTEYFDKKFSSK